MRTVCAVARIARSLEKLRTQVDRRWPGRNKASDGWIGDPAHASRPSDHNPNNAGVVCALDLTHDPGSGADMNRLAESLRRSRDPRIKYVIWNRRIFSSSISPWIWRTYSGSNPHTLHMHVSVSGIASLYDDASKWKLPFEPVRIRAIRTFKNRKALKKAIAWLKKHGFRVRR